MTLLVGSKRVGYRRPEHLPGSKEPCSLLVCCPELEQFRDSPRTQIFYEAPHRLQETLADVVEVMGPERQVLPEDVFHFLEQAAAAGLAGTRPCCDGVRA